MNVLGALPRNTCQAWLFAWVAVLSCATSSPATLLFDRGLPTQNLNNTAPNNLAIDANRSNISWAFADRIGSGYAYTVGDDFMLGTTYQQYIIDNLRVWLVIGVVNTSATIPNSFWQTLTLWGGNVKEGVPGLQNLHTGATDGSDLQIRITEVAYSNGEAYWAEPVSLYRKIWQVEFRSLQWWVQGGDRYQFFVNGTSFTSLGLWNVFPTLHASNASLSGSPQAGADDLYRLLRLRDNQPDHLGTWNSDGSGAPGSYTENGLPGFGGWNKSTDINVQIYGELHAPPRRSIPEPTPALALVLSGLAGLWAYRRRI